MIARLTTALICIFLTSAALAGDFDWPEETYQKLFCRGWKTERIHNVTEEGTVSDCISKNHVWEVDFTHKFYEGIGQSLHYSVERDLNAGLILVCGDVGDCTSYGLRLIEVVKKFELPLTILFCNAGYVNREQCVCETWRNGFKQKKCSEY